ncbi:MAG: hypothetical protein ASUL_07294 [Candidatus Aramenus sulfurataquae]|jgi:hypothetical protein|uniref:Uncharacterized protein n=3 Tax=Candidatus Aramenus sulfurataquae TaxID=1326980 RepID=W7KI42_9CREN|nr:MAG: hypothetical protein ASUL_07294 [Candidatus Aramenus sulfurataquae]
MEMKKTRNFVKDLVGVKNKIMSRYGILDIDDVFNKLLEFHKLGVINSIHSILQLIVASFLIKEGYRTSVEYETEGRVIDVYAVKGYDIGIEVETGFVPPNFADNQEEFLMSRTSLKIARYSNLAREFFIAVPSFYIPPIPDVFFESQEERREEELRETMNLIRKYHNVFDVNLKSLKGAKIDGIMVINTSDLKVKVFGQEEFSKLKKLYS